jgi:hypothetical protein
MRLSGSASAESCPRTRGTASISTPRPNSANPMEPAIPSRGIGGGSDTTYLASAAAGGDDETAISGGADRAEANRSTSCGRLPGQWGAVPSDDHSEMISSKVAAGRSAPAVCSLSSGSAWFTSPFCHRPLPRARHQRVISYRGSPLSRTKVVDCQPRRGCSTFAPGEGMGSGVPAVDDGARHSTNVGLASHSGHAAIMCR